MERLTAIIQHKRFREILFRLEECEREREYCCHGIEHLLAVARTAYALSLERGACVDKDLLYAAALLHDIGRLAQYNDGTPHEQAGVPLAREILQDTAFSEEERDCILESVRCHRARRFGGSSVPDLIFEADKRSRPCFLCKKTDSCKWPDERKNYIVTI
ncbi:MAG: HD domain-containing protein [Eubacteriales bacterium]|nr:HD domain-containing protein [Eubacteriales bacterium]